MTDGTGPPYTAEAKNERFVTFTGLDGAYASDASGLDTEGAYDDEDEDEDKGKSDREGSKAEAEKSDEEDPSEDEAEKVLPAELEGTPAPPPPTAVTSPTPRNSAELIDITQAAEIVKATESTADS